MTVNNEPIDPQTTWIAIDGAKITGEKFGLIIHPYNFHRNPVGTPTHWEIGLKFVQVKKITIKIHPDWKN